jgi:hypothetical protein
MLGLVMFQVSVVSSGTPFLCDTYDYTSLPNPKGPMFGEIFLETVCVEEILLSADAEECWHSTTLTSHTIFATLIFHRC